MRLQSKHWLDGSHLKAGLRLEAPFPRWPILMTGMWCCCRRASVLSRTPGLLEDLVFR